MTKADNESSQSGKGSGASGDAKAKFREALERKRNTQADRAADGDAQRGSKIHAEHAAAAHNRMFRRKSG